MHEQKTQLRIITALLVAVIALAAGLLFYTPQVTQAGTTPTKPPAPTPQKPHEKIRQAQISLDPSLHFTQTYGGSGDETVVEIFYENSHFYIFGNTTSCDYDLSTAGAYLAIIDEFGSTVDFVSYQGEVKDVTLYSGGFVMALDRDGAPIAYAVDLSGNEICSVALPCVRKEIPLDVKYVEGGYIFVTALTQEISGFSRLKLTKLTHALEFCGSVVTDEVYSLSYVDTLDVMGKYTLVANALSDIRKMLCIGTWGEKLAHYPKEFSYTVEGLWITDRVYYLAVTDSNTLLIGEDGTVIELGEYASGCTVTGDSNCLYVCAGESFYCVKDGVVTISARYGNTATFVHGKYVYAVSNLDGRLTVCAFSDGDKAHESSFVFEAQSAQVFVCESGLFVVCNTQGTFGGTDVTVIKVNY